MAIVAGKPQPPRKYCTVCGFTSPVAAVMRCPNDGGVMQFVERMDAYGKFLVEMRLHASLYGVTFDAMQLIDLYSVEVRARREYAAYAKGKVV